MSKYVIQLGDTMEKKICATFLNYLSRCIGDNPNNPKRCEPIVQAYIKCLEITNKESSNKEK